MPQALPMSNGMKKHIIALGGPPVSGKSTVRKILAEKLGYKTFSTGGFIRELAYNRQLSLEEFNTLMMKDSSIDVSVDEKLKHINDHEDNYVVDAHLAFHFVPDGFSVYLKISPEKAAERIYNDSQSESRIKSGEVMQSIDEARDHIKWRIQNNIERYEQLYGINPYKAEQYMFCVDAEKHTPEQTADIIIEAYTKWLKV